MTIGTGCAKVTIDAVVDDGFAGRFDRLAVVLAESPGVTDRLYLKAQESLSSEFAARANEGRVFIKPELTLDDVAFDREVAALAPDGVLVMRITAQTVDQYGSMLDATWQASLSPASSDRVIWRAHIHDTSLKFGLTQKKLAETMFAEFEDRGYVGPRIEPAIESSAASE